MVRYKQIGVGCVLILTVRGKHRGELPLEQLERIDDEMEIKEGGVNLTERTDVSTTEFEKLVKIEYAVQTKVSDWRMSNKAERIEAFTDLDDVSIWASVATAEFVEEEDG